MASGLSARLRKLEDCICLLGEMSGRLRYLQPSVHSLVVSLASQQRFEELSFLKECARLMGEGGCFSASWRTALKGKSHALGEEESAILASLGDVLGRSDLESQLLAIALVRDQLEQRISGAREKARTQGSLYRSMGLLGGVAAAIILF